MLVCLHASQQSLVTGQNKNFRHLGSSELRNQNGFNGFAGQKKGNKAVINQRFSREKMEFSKELDTQCEMFTHHQTDLK